MRVRLDGLGGRLFRIGCRLEGIPRGLWCLGRDRRRGILGVRDLFDLWLLLALAPNRWRTDFAQCTIFRHISVAFDVAVVAAAAGFTSPRRIFRFDRQGGW